MKNSRLKIATLLLSIFVLFSCNDTKKDNPNHIKVGVQVGPEYEVALAAQKVAKEKYGLDVELIKFTDYVQPNEALNSGDLDANACQHKPYLDDQIAKRGYKLTVVGNTFVYPLAGYSDKIKSIDEIKEGNTIVVPNDPTNGGRALLLLEKVGLIKLKDGVGLTPKVTDITEKTKNIKIVELEGPQLPRVMKDANITIAVINNTFASQVGLLIKDGVFVEDKESPYVNVIVTREDNKEEEKVKKFVQAYQSEEVEKVATEQFKGGSVKGW